MFRDISPCSLPMWIVPNRITGSTNTNPESILTPQVACTSAPKSHVCRPRKTHPPTWAPMTTLTKLSSGNFGNSKPSPRTQNLAAMLQISMAVFGLEMLARRKIGCKKAVKFAAGPLICWAFAIDRPCNKSTVQKLLDQSGNFSRITQDHFLLFDRLLYK